MIRVVSVGIDLQCKENKINPIKRAGPGSTISNFCYYNVINECPITDNNIQLLCLMDNSGDINVALTFN